MILVSLDGVSNCMFKGYQKTFLDKGFVCAKELRTVFPSVTYPAHRSILTGCSPKTHGIFENKISSNEDMKIRRLYGRYDNDFGNKASVHTVVDVLQGVGKSCKVIGWPLFPKDFYCENTFISQGKIRAEEKNDLEKFGLLCDYIKNKSEDLVVVQFLQYDTCAHVYGANSFKALEAFEILLGYVDYLKILCDRYGENMIVVSDHGMVDKTKSFFPNVWLRESGFGNLLDNNYMRFVCDGSGAVLFYSKTLGENTKKVLELIKDHEFVNDAYEVVNTMNNPIVPVGIVDLVKGVCGEDVFEEKSQEYSLMKALHGYDPVKVNEMNGMFMVYGKDFLRGKLVESVDIMDIAPTIAHFFGVDYRCEGKVIKNIFEGVFSE